MRLKPGQTAPQIPPRGPKGPIKKPLAAQPIKNAAPAVRPKGGIGMTGGPKPSGLSNTPTDKINAYNNSMQSAIAAQKAMGKVPSNPIANILGPKPSIPTPVNPSPARPPLKAAPVTGVTRGRVEQNYRGIPGLVDASMDMPNFKGGASNKLANVNANNFQRARATPQGAQSAMNAGPKPSGLMGAMSGAGAPQGQRTQSGSMAAMGGAATGMLKPFGAKKGGAVPSKMGAVKTSASRDGIAKKGKTKGRMV